MVLGMQELEISIVIATFNAAKTLERCLQSIVPQLTDATELVIVDGGSEDETLSIIKKYEQYVAYTVSEPDKGIYDAWNKGVKVAHGEWIWRMDNVYRGRRHFTAQCTYSIFNKTKKSVNIVSISVE